MGLGCRGYSDESKISLSSEDVPASRQQWLKPEADSACQTCFSGRAHRFSLLSEPGSRFRDMHV